MMKVVKQPVRALEKRNDNFSHVRIFLLTYLGSCPNVVNQEIDEVFSPDEQARTWREIRARSSSITKSGQEPSFVDGLKHTTVSRPLHVGLLGILSHFHPFL